MLPREDFAFTYNCLIYKLDEFKFDVVLLTVLLKIWLEINAFSSRFQFSVYQSDVEISMPSFDLYIKRRLSG